MATPVTPGGNAKHCDGCRDPANCEIVSDPCSACRKQFNEVTGKAIILAGKKFHEACLKCKDCRKRVRRGWTIVHPAGIFCNDTCMQSTLESANRRSYGPSCNDDMQFFVIDWCILCNMPINEARLETWIDCDGIRIHQQCFKCEACGTPPLSPEGEVILCAERFWCDDNCLQSSNEKAVKVYYQPTEVPEDESRGGNDDPVNGEDVNDQCGVCNKPINEVPGEQPISCGEKQFHRSCFKCLDCGTRLKRGWILMHPDGGLFCSSDYYYVDRCIRSFGAKATQVSYKPNCNDDNNSNVNNCLVCKMPVNNEHLETCVNCSGSIIHQECFKCKACDATPPPKGEIMAVKNWFFCNDDCIRSFGEKAVKVDYQPTTPVRVIDATKETADQTRGINKWKMIRRMKAIASPAIVAEDPSIDEKSHEMTPDEVLKLLGLK